MFQIFAPSYIMEYINVGNCLVWGEAEQEARELKHLGLCKSTDTQCWCFQLCLHFTPTSYLGSEA